MGILVSISLPSFKYVTQKRDRDWTARYHVGEKKTKKKTKSQLFFLVGHKFSISEDSSNIEYSESALKFNSKVIVILKEDGHYHYKIFVGCGMMRPCSFFPDTHPATNPLRRLCWFLSNWWTVTPSTAPSYSIPHSNTSSSPSVLKRPENPVQKTFLCSDIDFHDPSLFRSLVKFYFSEINTCSVQCLEWFLFIFTFLDN